MSLAWKAWLGQCLVISALAADQPAGLSLRWITPDPDRPSLVRVECAGLEAGLSQTWTPQEWQKVMSVHADQAEMAVDVNLPPMAGQYEWRENSVVFTPLFPLQPEVRYRAVFRPEALPDGGPAGAKVLSAIHRLEKPAPGAATRVTHVSPEAASLPENTLKFYLHFSAPMSGGGIYQHVRLRKEGGEVVHEPFLEIDQEMWNHGMTRLTLFIDPGRIKQGLAPRADLGTALQEGRQYTLEIDAGWQDAKGQPLKAGHQKTFKVGPPDRKCPSPSHWSLKTPAAGSREVLKVVFDEPLDEALALRLLTVASDKGSSTKGTASLTSEGREWRFSPKEPWLAGSYKLEVPDILEDLAGNSVGRPFEVDVFSSVQPPGKSATERLPFVVRESEDSPSPQR